MTWPVAVAIAVAASVCAGLAALVPAFGAARRGGRTRIVRRIERDPRAYVSKERLTQLQCDANPVAFRRWGEDKLEFFLRCRHSGLPTPDVLAVSGRPVLPGGSS